MAALATVPDVTVKLEEEPTARMLTMIAAYLEDASDAARYYGREWTPIDCPAAVSRIVASAVARFMRNPDNYSQSRAGDETVSWAERDEEIDWFTEKEIARLGKIAAAVKVAAFGTFQLVAGTNGHRSDRPRVQDLVATDGGTGTPFLWGDPANPWGV